MVLLEPARRDAAGGDGGAQGAVGLAVVAAVAEAAFVEMRMELAEALLDLGAAEVGLHTFWVTENGGPPPAPDLPLDGFGPYPAFVDRVIHGWLDALGDAPLGRSQQRSLAHRLAVAPAAVDAIRRPHPEVILECCPDEGEWSARDIVCHLRDYESQARERLERILRGDNPFLSANTNPWEYSSMYHKVAFEGALSVFAERRAQTVEWLRSLPDDAWRRPARDAIFGPTYFEEVVGFIAEHDRTHLRQMRSAIDYALTICAD